MAIFGRSGRLARAPRRIARKVGLSRVLKYTAKIEVGGSVFFVPLDGDISENLLYVKSGFKSAMLARLPAAIDTKVFVDIGANLGQSMLEAFAFDREMSYSGFEPNPQAFVVLQTVARLNGFKAALFPWACAAAPEPLRLFTSTVVDQAGTIVPGIRPDAYEGAAGAWIPTYPLDLVSPGMDLPDRFVMKIDVEGAEVQVLRGAQMTIARHRPAILCEVLHAHRPAEISSNDAHKAELEALLDTLSYNIYACPLADDGATLTNVVKIACFPRGIVWRDAPNSCDYLFLPRELDGDISPAPVG